MSWTHPRTWLPETITVDKLNTEIRDNFEVLKNPPHAEYAPAYAAGTLISTTSDSFVDMTNFTLNLTTGGGDVLVILNVNADAIGAYFDIKVNNARIGGSDGIMGSSYGVMIIWLLRDIEPQTLSLQAVWKRIGGAGTANILSSTRPYFSAREIS